MAKSLLLIPVIALIGIGLALHTGMIDKPSFGVQDEGDWGEVTDEKTEIVTTVWINNENPVGLDMNEAKLSYQLLMNDVKLAEGEKNEIVLEKGNQTKELRTYLINDRISTWWAKHLNNDEVSSLEIPVNLQIEEPISLNIDGISYQDSISTDIEATMTRSVGRMEGTYYGPEIPVLERPEIQVTGGSAEFGEVNKNQTNLIFTLDVHNPNSYPVPAPGLAGNLEMNDVALAEWDRSDAEVIEADKQVIQAGETQKVRFTARMNNQKIDDWLVQHIRKDEKTDAEVEIKLQFELEGVEFTVPAGEGMKCQFQFQTGILVDGQESSSQFKECEIPERSLTGQNTDSNDQSTDNSSDEEDSNPIIDDTSYNDTSLLR